MTWLCGLDCGDCEAYVATQKNDRAGLEATVKKWAAQFGAKHIDADMCICDGCPSGNANWRETWIRLTQKGKMVFSEIDHRRNEINDGVARELRALASSERGFLNSFIENMKRFVDRYLP